MFGQKPFSILTPLPFTAERAFQFFHSQNFRSTPPQKKPPTFLCIQSFFQNAFRKCFNPFSQEQFIVWA